MATPGDLCTLQDLKLYMGGANVVDTSNDQLFATLISAASLAISRYLDRDLLSLGGQGFSTIAATGADSGGPFVTLVPPLFSTPPLGGGVIDFTSGINAGVISPAAGQMNCPSKMYVTSTNGFQAGDDILFAFFNAYSETLDGTGKPWQWVRQWPIVSLVSVIDIPSGQPYTLSMLGADLELPRIVFVTPPAAAPPPLVLPDGTVLGGIFNPGVQNLQVTYTAGYPEPPADLAQAARELVLLWFRDRDRLGVSGQSILGTHASFFNTSDLAPETRFKLTFYRRTMRSF